MWPCALVMKGLDLGVVEENTEERGVVIGHSNKAQPVELEVLEI